MNPVPHERRAMGAFALGYLVLVMGENEVESAAVNVESLAEQSLAHGRAFDVPARTTPAPRAGPSRQLGRAWLPQHEIRRILFVGRDIDPGSGDQFLAAMTREAAVVRHAGHAEQHMTFGLVGMALGDQ